MKRILIKALYRLLRNDMAARMKMSGFTWSKTNTVLEALGQKIIISYEHKPTGIMLTYGKPPNRRSRLKRS